MKQRLAEWLHQQLLGRVACRREPDLIVGADNPDGPYLLRWYLTPWRRWRDDATERPTRVNRAKARISRNLPNLYLHKFLRDDDDRAHHDHPSWALSLMLFRGYNEHTIAAGGIHHRRYYGPGALRFLSTRHTHRIELTRSPLGVPQSCWTLFLFGPAKREWGFHCPDRGWVHWRDFTAEGKPGEVGKGCDA